MIQTKKSLREEAKKWREIAQTIERRKSCGSSGLCSYLDSYRNLSREGLWLFMANRVDNHTKCHAVSVAQGVGSTLCSDSIAGNAYCANKGVWEPRVLLAYFLSYEAADEANCR